MTHKTFFSLHDFSQITKQLNKLYVCQKIDTILLIFIKQTEIKTFKENYKTIEHNVSKQKIYKFKFFKKAKENTI